MTKQSNSTLQQPGSPEAHQQSEISRCPESGHDIGSANADLLRKSTAATLIRVRDARVWASIIISV